MDEKKQGGLTGATGSLTPSDPDDEFVPAETREMSDPAAARRITTSAHRRAEDRGTGQAEDATGPPVTDERKPQQTRGGGYGSGEGLSGQDPAYRMEERALPPPEGQPQAGEGQPATGEGQPPTGEPVLGGDERRSPEDEHL
jgi:hypothetical protein